MKTVGKSTITSNTSSMFMYVLSSCVTFASYPGVRLYHSLGQGDGTGMYYVYGCSFTVAVSRHGGKLRVVTGM